MAITYNKDKRSGRTYAYETTYTWDPEKKQSRSKRRLLGRVDEETGEIVPTDGRGKKRSPYYIPEEDSLPESITELRELVLKLRKENAELHKKLASLQKK